MRFLLALLPALALAPVLAAAPDLLVPDLEQRLAQGGVEAVNAYLAGQGAPALAALNQKTAGCELQAVSLSMRLGRGTQARAVQAHREALRTAVGLCTAFVLDLATPEEVPRYCMSVAAWSVTQTARELRRRMAAIEADEALRTSPKGKACHAAYHHELHNTRIVLKSQPR